MGAGCSSNFTSIIPIEQKSNVVNTNPTSFLHNFLITAINEQGVSGVTELSDSKHCESSLKAVFFKDILTDLKSYNFKDININYDDSYNPKIINPYYNDRSEILITTWLQSYNLLNTSKIQKLRPLNFASYILPYSNYEHLLLAGKFFALFVIIDDDLIETSKYESKDLSDFWNLWILEKFVASNKELSNFTKAMLDLKNSYLRLGASQYWCNTMSLHLESWITLGIGEAKLSSMICNLQNTDSQNTLEILGVAFNNRIYTIGTPFFILLMERSSGFNITHTKIYKNMVDLASIQTFLVNELLGMPRDYYTSNKLIYSNIALIYKKLQNLSIDETFKFVLYLHHKAILNFEKLSDQFVFESSDKFLTTQFITNLKYLIRGYAMWHQNSYRYKEHILISDKDMYLFCVTEEGNIGCNDIEDKLISEYVNSM